MESIGRKVLLVVATLALLVAPRVSGIAAAASTCLWDPGTGTLIGSRFADTLTGNSIANELFGRGGNDVINGRGGSDAMEGEGGTRDVVSFAGAPSAITASLTAATASGWGADTLSGFEEVTGSARADVLSGSVGTNTIRSGATPCSAVRGSTPASRTADRGPRPPARGPEISTV